MCIYLFMFSEILSGVFLLKSKIKKTLGTKSCITRGYKYVKILEEKYEFYNCVGM